MSIGNLTIEPPHRDCRDGVTIAIPNWNHEYFLPRSITSALRTIEQFAALGVAAEALIVDDGSRDGSLPLLRQLEALLYDEGVRVLALKQNGGLGAARNAALRHATYRYLVFLDADNELIPENAHYFYRAIRDTGAALAYGNLLRRDMTQQAHRLMSNESFRDRIFGENYIDACALGDRLQLLDCGGYQTGELLHGWDDYELNLHLATQGRRLVFVPMVFAIYHSLPNSLINDIARQEEKARGRVNRMFNQIGVRDRMPHNTRHLRYHPDIGYL